MRLEIDIPEHHYNNIMDLDSVSLERVPYKAIIMYAINAIKRGKALEQEPTAKNDLAVDKLLAGCEKMSFEIEIFNKPLRVVALDAVKNIVKGLPSVTPQEPQTFKWCTTCKEYDQEKHCCPRWSKVIRNTVEELKQEYIEREELDKIRDEIEQEIIPRNSDQYDHEAMWQNMGLRMALKVIDKYKAETEDT